MTGRERKRTVNNPKLTVPTNLVRAIGLMLRPNRDLAILNLAFLPVETRRWTVSMRIICGKSMNLSFEGRQFR